MTLLPQAFDLHQLDAGVAAGRLLRVGTPAHHHRGASRRRAVHDRAGALRRTGRLDARLAQDAGERQVHAFERAEHAGPQGRRRVAQRVDQLIGALVALATLADAAIDDLLQVVAARETAHVAGAEALLGAALHQHADELTDLVHVVARLPLRHHTFDDLARRGESIHPPGGGPAAIC